MADCIVDIMTKTGVDIETAQDAFDTIAQQRNLLMRDIESAQLGASLADYARKAADDAEIKAKIVYREKLDNIIKTDAAEKEITELGALTGKKSFLKSMTDWVFRIDDSIKEEQGVLSGPYRLWKSENKTEYRLLESDRDAQREFIRARHELGAGSSRPDNLDSVNSKIWDFAELVNQNEEAIRIRANDYGAQIGKRKGYGGRHSHDDGKIGANPDGHLKMLEETLNLKKTFPWLNQLTPDEQAAAMPDLLRQVQRHIVNGKDDDFAAINPNDYLKGRQMAKRASSQLEKSRELIFQDTEAWIKYNDGFGRDGVLGGLFEYTRNYGKTIPILRKLGTKPESALSSIIDKQTRILQKSDITDKAAAAELDALRKTKIGQTGFGLGGAWQVVSQQDKNPASKMWGGIFSGLRNWNSMTKLGSALASQITDFPIAAMVYKTRMGMSFLDSIGLAMRSNVERIAPDLRKEFGHILSAYCEGFQNNMGERIGGGIELPGRISNATQFFFDITGMTAYTNNAKMAGVWAISRTLGGDASKNFSQLNEALQYTLKDRGLDRYWDVMREHMAVKRGEDTFIIPEKARTLPDKVVDTFIADKITAAQEAASLSNYDPAPSIERLRRTARSDIEMDYGSFMAAMTNDITPTPDAKIRYWQTWGGLQAGTMGGEFARTSMQFKSFPILSFLKILMPMLVGRPGQALSGRLANTGMLLASLTAMGYVSVEAKRLVKGYKPYFMMDEGEADPLKIAGEAFMQGGGAGIWGDFLFSEVNQYGGGLAETLAGPTAGMAGDLLRMVGKGVQGDLKLSEVFDTMVNNTPYAGVWYTRSLLNYSFLNGIREGLSPGYLRQKENYSSNFNRPYLLPPSEYSFQPF